MEVKFRISDYNIVMHINKIWVLHLAKDLGNTWAGRCGEKIWIALSETQAKKTNNKKDAI